MTTMKHPPSEILAALIGLTEAETITADIEKLQRAIYVARELSPLLSVFVFSETGAYPFSRTLDDALGRLKIARVVRMENTDYRNFLLTSDAKRFIKDNILPNFEPAEQASLARVARVVRDKWVTSGSAAETAQR